jgi:polysaccharide biosynthesis PFTS motif protein
LTGFHDFIKKDVIVFEEIDLLSLPFIIWYLVRGSQIHCFSIKPALENTVFIQKWIHQEKIVKLEYGDSDLNEQYYLNNVVLDEIEKIFEDSFRENRTVAVINTLIGSEDAAISFKKSLSLNLFEFYRMNLFFERGYNKAIGKKGFLFVPGPTYQKLKKIRHVQQTISRITNVKTPLGGVFYCGLLSLTNRIKYCTLLLCFPFWILLKIGIPPLNKEEIKSFQVGIRICYNDWPLGNKYRRFDYLIDDNLVTRENTLLCLEEKITDSFKQQILDKKYHYVDVRDILKNANFPYIKKIVIKKFLPAYLVCLANSLVEHIFILELSPEILFKYLEWTNFEEKYQIHHYVSYCEHLPADAIRNIILEKQGVSTWNYAHSNATNDFFTPPGYPDFIEKFYAYFYYDNFVVWGRKMRRYYQQHPINIKHYPALGCLWSEHVRMILENDLPNDTLNNARRKFFEKTQRYPEKIIGVFDVNTGGDSPLFETDLIAFIKGILQILEENPNIGVIIKKKESSKILSSRVPNLITYYKEIQDHPRCYLTDESNSDPSETIAASDLVISAPFTSPTIESLGAKKKAIYYDATGKCRGCYFDQFPQFVPHDYDELKIAIDYWLNKVSEEEFHSFLNRYVLVELDEYLDGKAITRFRQQLSQRRGIQDGAI